jgi:hypothetical protein
MDKNPQVPGNEAKAAIEDRIERDMMGFMAEYPGVNLSNYKGYSYNFKFYNHHSAKAHMVEQVKAT